MNQTFMKEKSILPLVLSMSLPMVLSMLVNSLYNIIDSYFVAKISEDAMTALSLVFPLQNLVSAIGVGFGIGINAVAAFYLGAKKQDMTNAAASVGLLLNALHGLLLTAACLLLMPRFLALFTQNEQIIAYGLTYSEIVFAFSIMITVSVSFEKIFQAEGQMTVSMISMMAGCVMNIVLDPLFIFGAGPIPAMGIEGAAFATGIGHTTAFIIYLIIYLKKPLPIRLCFNREIFQKELCIRLYAVGIPAALNIALPSLLITVLNGILASFSQTYVLILGIYYKLQTFIYLTANGIIQGIRPIIGYNYGAGEYERVKKIYHTALTLVALVMTAGMLICLLIPDWLMGLFTANLDTIHTGRTALRFISLGFTASAISVTTSGALEGLGKGTPSLIISLLRYVLLIIPTAFVLSRIFGAVGVWHAFWLTEIFTAAASWFIFQTFLSNFTH